MSDNPIDSGPPETDDPTGATCIECNETCDTPGRRFKSGAVLCPSCAGETLPAEVMPRATGVLTELLADHRAIRTLMAPLFEVLPAKLQALVDDLDVERDRATIRELSKLAVSGSRALSASGQQVAAALRELEQEPPKLDADAVLKELRRLMAENAQLVEERDGKRALQTANARALRRRG